MAAKIMAQTTSMMTRLAAGLLMAATLTTAFAQGYPNKPIRMIVPWPPTGTVDILGRTLGQKLGDLLGQSIVIDNRGGANGMIGTDMAAKAAPDGYTILVENVTGQTINAALHEKKAFDLYKDLTPVSLLAWVPN
ncbi:MAG: Bug family tripartite tricarboxylate transporter substrate binding protein, partial [Burkholderiales bacterium]